MYNVLLTVNQNVGNRNKVNMKKKFTNANVLIDQTKGVEPTIFIIEDGRVYIIGITPDYKFDLSDEGMVGEKWDEHGNWCK